VARRLTSPARVLNGSARRTTAAALERAAGAVALLLWVVLVVPWSRLVRARRARPAILWGPVPVPNIVYTSRADRLYGYRSETVVYESYAITRRDEFDHVLDRWRRLPGLRRLVPYGAFVWAGLRFDVFGFFFDGGLLWATPSWRTELRLLKLAGKRIVVYPYGSDARLPSVVRARGGWHAYSDVEEGAEDRDESDVRARLAAFGRYADTVFGCGDLYEDLPRVDGMLRYAFDARAWAPEPFVERDVVTVVHAPNHRHFKGTRHLEAAVARLREEGLPVELQLVEGVTNEVAREAYRGADVIADQFLIGSYALFAIEGMALGKPVVCYLADRFRPAHPEWDECPIANANPDTLADVLRELVTSPDLRRRLGERGPEYVRRWHSLESVGATLDAVYRRIW
jgi:hypothetical protein